MAEERQMVWISRYALAGGVKELPLIRADDDGYAWVEIKGGPSYGEMMGRADWHRTKEAALARAEEMRTAKIASHEKSIAKLNKLTFA